MTLDQLIYKRLSEDTALKSSLARYGTKPAVFFMQAPADTDDTWKGRQQYPRIDYVIDIQANPERHTFGQMTLNVWCRLDNILPEQLEPLIRAAVCDIFMKPDEEPPYYMRWTKSEPFQGAGTETIVAGTTLFFDIYSFPTQISTDPDPIVAINEYAKDFMPDAVIIGRDPVEQFYRPSEKCPAVYFRLGASSINRQTNTVVWLDATIYGHVFGPPVTRLELTQFLSHKLSLDGEIYMLDDSPMLVRGIVADNAADHVALGQLAVKTEYGLLRRKPYVHTLNNAYIAKEG